MFTKIGSNAIGRAKVADNRSFLSTSVPLQTRRRASGGRIDHPHWLMLANKWALSITIGLALKHNKLLNFI